MSVKVLLSIVIVALLGLVCAETAEYFSYTTGSTSECGTLSTGECSPVHWKVIDESCGSSDQQSPINFVSTAVTRSPYMFGPVAGSVDNGCSVSLFYTGCHWERPATNM
jgi:carbonic anhydrase